MARSKDNWSLLISLARRVAVKCGCRRAPRSVDLESKKSARVIQGGSVHLRLNIEANRDGHCASTAWVWYHASSTKWIITVAAYGGVNWLSEWVNACFLTAHQRAIRSHLLPWRSEDWEVGRMSQAESIHSLTHALTASTYIHGGPKKWYIPFGVWVSCLVWCVTIQFLFAHVLLSLHDVVLRLPV